MTRTIVVELPEAVYEALAESAESNGQSLEEEAAVKLTRDVAFPRGIENLVDLELMKRGLLREVPAGKASDGTRYFLNRPLDPPLSQSIIEDRR